MLTVACSQENHSHIKHDFGKMLPDNARSNFWQDVSIEQYKKYAKNFSYIDIDSLATDHEAALYLNQWVSQIHQQVMKRSKGLKIPEPKIIIETNENSIGGYVNSISFCTDVKLILGEENDS